MASNPPLPEPFAYKGVDMGRGGPPTGWPGRIVYYDCAPAREEPRK